MVVLYSKEGQFANRLWQAAYFIANAIDNDYLLLHLGFAEYVIYFNMDRDFQLKKYRNIRIVDFKTTTLREKIIIKYANLSKAYKKKHFHHFLFVEELYYHDDKPDAIGYDLSQDLYIKEARKKILLVDGWKFVDRVALNKYAGVIREIFTPIKIKEILRLVEANYRKYDKVIGVHVRKGDYASFNEGKWFYSNDDFVDFMVQITSLPVFRSKRIAFFLCSDQKINYNDFSFFNIIPSTGNLLEDLYTLSFCDLILGPPSTFSAWASFYGNKPLLHIYHKNLKISEEQFIRLI